MSRLHGNNHAGDINPQTLVCLLYYIYSWLSVRLSFSSDGDLWVMRLSLESAQSLNTTVFTDLYHLLEFCRVLSW